MSFKPMKQWSVEEVATWLFCTGHGDKAPHFLGVSGLDLTLLTSTEDLVNLGLSPEAAAAILPTMEFATSLCTLQDLSSTLETLQLENTQLLAELTAKDATIFALEQQLGTTVSPADSADNNNTRKVKEDDCLEQDQLLYMEHKHEVERRHLEEQQEQETKAKEFEIHRKHDTHNLSPDQTLETTHTMGKRHFHEQPVEAHRYY